MKHFILFLLLIVSSKSFTQNRDVVGCYSSNFAVVGWFVMHIELKSDSTFYYCQRGDLMFDGASGIYQVNKGNIELTYDIPKYDTIYFVYKDSLNFTDSIALPQRISHLEHTRPYRLAYKKKKLFLISENGKKNKKNKDRKGRLRKHFLKAHIYHDEKGW